MATTTHRPNHQPNGAGGYYRRGGRAPHHLLELSQCLLDFVVQLLPSKDEVSVKEDVRKLLERLIKTIEPSAQLLSFGSTANGFELKNSDMDLCCLLDLRTDPPPSASQFVLRAAQLLERETKFTVKPLPNARIPIIKLSLQPSPSIPFGIACDIGFENRLALENTRLLFTYAAIDPTRVRTLVLFLKLWSKRRKINSPYHGTLSSYGYVLLIIFFLVHVKDHPVLPNLQQMPPMRPISPSDTHINGRNVWFFDDVDLLRRKWQSPNTDTIGELLLDFFRYFSRDFNYTTTVASIRAGHLPKESDPTKPVDPREGTSLWIEDPFETSFNVGRCVTRDGLYTIRGEFMRAVRILSTKHEVAMSSLASLCEEREDDVPRSVCHQNSFNKFKNPGSPRSHSAGGSPVVPKLGLSIPGNRSQEAFKPQFAPSTPITITAPSPNAKPFVPAVLPPTMVPPPHMAPQRSKWTSPPPDHAPPQRHNSFNERLASGIKLAVTHPHPDRILARSSPGSSVTDEDVEEILDNVSVDTRPSSPASSAGKSISEFKSRGQPPIRIQEALDEEEKATTPKPILQNGSEWRHVPQRSPTAPTDFKRQGKRNDYNPNRQSLPSLTIPSSLPFFSPSSYSPSGLHWPQDFSAPNQFTPMPPFRSNHGYRDGPRHGRNGNKGHMNNNQFGMGQPSPAYTLPHIPQLAVMTPPQLPTPPVSSPLPNLHLSPIPSSPPLLRLEEPPATSAR